MNEAGGVKYQENRSTHWQAIALGPKRSRILGRTYHQYLQKLYRFLVPPGTRILELGCGRGDLLAALQPACGVGVDFAPAMLAAAEDAHPELHFLQADAHDLIPELAPELLSQPFDVIILSDIINDAWDVLQLLKTLKIFCNAQTRIIINFHSHLWEHPFHLLQYLNLVTPRLPQNWFTPQDVKDLMLLAGYKIIRSFDEYLFPWPIPGLSTFFNRFLAKIWPFSCFNLFHVLIARPLLAQAPQLPSVSVIIPARNEAGNIEAACARVPELGGGGG